MPGANGTNCTTPLRRAQWATIDLPPSCGLTPNQRSPQPAEAQKEKNCFLYVPDFYFGGWNQGFDGRTIMQLMETMELT